MSGDFVRTPVRRAWHRLLEARARDYTATSARRRAVVLVPHPDDETFGAGATIARKCASGTRVDVVIVTDGRLSHRSQLVSPTELAEMRANEARAACAALGVPAEHVHLLGVPEGTLAAHRTDIQAAVHEIITAAAPHEILTTSARDWHEDHQTVAHLARGFGLAVLEFPIWWWADGPWNRHEPGRGMPQRLLHLAVEPMQASVAGPVLAVETGGFLDQKRAAIAAYRSQTTNLTGEADWAVLDDAWTGRFLGRREVFFPVADTIVPHPSARTAGNPDRFAHRREGPR